MAKYARFGGMLVFLAEKRDECVISDGDFETLIDTWASVISNAGAPNSEAEDRSYLTPVLIHAAKVLREQVVELYPQLADEFDLRYSQFLQQRTSEGGRGIG